MPFPVAAAATAFEVVLGVVDFIFGRVEAADTTRRLEAIDAKLDDLDASIGRISGQVLANEVGAVTAARNQLANFALLETDDPAIREGRRLDVIDAADLALQRVLAQADELIEAASGAEAVAVAASAVNYAVLTRMQVAARLEAGPVGALGIRDALDSAFLRINDAYEAMRAIARSDIEAIADLEVIPHPFIGDGVLRIGAQHKLFGNATTERVTITFEQLASLGFGGQVTDIPHVGAALDRRVDRVVRATEGELGVPGLLAIRGEYENLSFGADLVGDGLDNLLESTSDAAFGQLSNDFIAGLGGDDTIAGSQGADALRGDTGDDRIDGRGGIDMLTGGPGDDTLDGGEGQDTARFSGRAADYTVEGGIARALVTGPDGTDLLFGVESLLFDDAEIVLGEGGAPGPLGLPHRIALLYEAALDRNGAIDAPGLNFWIDQREAGVSERTIAARFLESREFERSFGDADDMDDRAIVDTLYRNILDRDGEPQGVAFWAGRLKSADFDRSDLLLAFSVSDENLAGSAFIERLIEVEEGVWDFA